MKRVERKKEMKEISARRNPTEKVKELEQCNLKGEKGHEKRKGKRRKKKETPLKGERKKRSGKVVKRVRKSAGGNPPAALIVLLDDEIFAVGMATDHECERPRRSYKKIRYLRVKE
jgi:hypothetical protein